LFAPSRGGWWGGAGGGPGATAGGGVVCSRGGAAGIGARSMTSGRGRQAGAVAFRQLSTAVAIAPCTSSTIPALRVQYRRFAWFVVANAVMGWAPAPARPTSTQESPPRERNS